MSDNPRCDNSFVGNMAGTPGRDRTEATIEDIRRKGGVFVDAVRATRMAMVLTDPNLPGNPIVFANQAFLDLSGYDMDEVLGQQPYFLNGADTDTSDARRFRGILEKDRDGTVETVQYAKDGRRFVATVLLSAFKGDDGQTLYHFLSWSDVTRRVDAEDDASELRITQTALRESEAKYRTLFNSLDEGFCVIEVIFDADQNPVDYVFLETNAAFEDQTGLAHAVGRRMRDIQPDHEQYWFDIYGEIALTGEPRRFERQAEKLERWYDVYAFRLSPPEARHVAILFKDIAARKCIEQALLTSEARQRALIEGVPQLVWRARDIGDWTWSSPQWTEFTGQSPEESQRWGWLRPLHPDDRELARAAWATAEHTGQFEADYRIRTVGSGDYRWFQTRATPVRNASGEIVEWLGTSTDVDDLRRLQEQQAALAGELQHRTFNLMSLIQATADATIRSASSLEDFRGTFHDRIAGLSRVQRLLSRIADSDRVSFDEVLRTELAAVGALPENDARVTLDGPAGVALRSRSVQTVAMALHELITNAIKYGALNQPAAHLDVRWRVRVGKDGKPWLQIDWSETGVSMPPAGTAPQGTGQGRRLIEKVLPYQDSAETSYALTDSGVRCSITLPVSAKMERSFSRAHQ